jgi:hypothetical protein
MQETVENRKEANPRRKLVAGGTNVPPGRQTVSESLSGQEIEG